MDIRNLPVPVNNYPVNASRSTAFTPAQEQDREQQVSTQTVNESEEVIQETNNPQQNIETNLQILLQQRNQQEATGNLEDSQIRYSAQQAVDTYRIVNSQENEQSDTQVLSRVDELV